MLKKIIALILFVVLTACSSEKETKPSLWSASTYSTEINGTSVILSLHPLDDIEDILQADVLIHHIDGSGPSFEVQNANIESNADLLTFKWTDGFGNKGTAELKPIGLPLSTQSVTTQVTGNLATKNRTVDNTKQKLLFTLKIDEVINERNMMFIDQYTLTKTSEQASEPLLQPNLAEPSEKSKNTENSEN